MAGTWVKPELECKPNRVSTKFRFVFWDTVRALMMEAARTSETSVDNYFTRQYIPEDKSELHNRRRENLKSHRVSTMRR
jgi:hypothetical protein